MIDVGGGYLLLPAVETAGYEMLDAVASLFKSRNFKRKGTLKVLRTLATI